MEVRNIEEMKLSAEINETEHKKDSVSKEVSAKKCIYKEETQCTAPNCTMKMCENCPYGKEYTFNSTLKDVFSKIVSLAIFLAKSDDVLKDVIALISKTKDLEGNNIDLSKNNSMPSTKITPEKTCEEIVEDEVDIKGKPVLKIDTYLKPNIRKISSIKASMSAQIARKVTDLEEALANPNGSNGKPLV